jgi:hypothetical protein
MTEESLAFINTELTSAGIPYEFMEWTSKMVYPYFVGEYTEPEPMNEDGMQESSFMITGTTDGSWLDLEKAKAKIEKLFSNRTVILPNGNGLAVLYSGSLVVPTGNSRMKRIQINLSIQEWKVN